MRTLIAEDDPTTRYLLESTVRGWGYEVIATADGEAAWQELQREQAPELVLLDWKMPKLDGLEVCRRVRGSPQGQCSYLILLTGKGDDVQDVVAGLQAGADDYIAKPFDPAELKARLQTGARIVGLQRSLAERVRELEGALSRVKQLQGLLPICAYCKKIRDDQNYWQQVEAYLGTHADVRFSHGVCPECFERIVKPEMAALGTKPPEDKPS